jgi:hypothetical protein
MMKNENEKLKENAIGPADIPQRLGQICIQAPITPRSGTNVLYTVDRQKTGRKDASEWLSFRAPGGAGTSIVHG